MSEDIKKAAGAPEAGPLTSVGIVTNSAIVDVINSPLQGNGNIGLAFKNICSTPGTFPVTGDTGHVTISPQGAVLYWEPGTASGGGGGGTGTVTSIGVQSSTGSITVSPTSPVTTAGTFNINLATQNITAGSYVNPTVTVNNKGIVTNIAASSAAANVTIVDYGYATFTPGAASTFAACPAIMPGAVLLVEPVYSSAFSNTSPCGLGGVTLSTTCGYGTVGSANAGVVAGFSVTPGNGSNALGFFWAVLYNSSVLNAASLGSVGSTIKAISAGSVNVTSPYSPVNVSVPTMTATSAVFLSTAGVTQRAALLSTTAGTGFSITCPNACAVEYLVLDGATTATQSANVTIQTAKTLPFATGTFSPVPASANNTLAFPLLGTNPVSTSYSTLVFGCPLGGSMSTQLGYGYVISQTGAPSSLMPIENYISEFSFASGVAGGGSVPYAIPVLTDLSVVVVTVAAK